MDFAAPLMSRVKKTHMKKLTSIQYHSFRNILKRRGGSSSSKMYKELNVKPLTEHFENLKKRYLNKALDSNPMICELFEDLKEYLKERDEDDKIEKCIKENISMF